MKEKMKNKIKICNTVKLCLHNNNNNKKNINKLTSLFHDAKTMFKK